MTGRLFYASLSTETNSFSNIPTTYQSFEQSGILSGPDVIYDADGNCQPGAEAIIRRAAEHNLEVVAGISASASPGKPVEQADYLRLKQRLLKHLQNAMPVKTVVLVLHGAMMATDCEDCEGDMLTDIRNLVGENVPIGAVLDPHAHLSETMVQASDVLIFMKEYPHIDGAERMQELLNILFAKMSGEVEPVPCVYDCQLMGFFPTQTSPMKDFVAQMKTEELADPILSVSFVHGFPWGDNTQAGAKVLVYSDGNYQAASAVAEGVGQAITAIREECGVQTHIIEAALALARQKRKQPLILADLADNPGGGAPSDSTFILHALYESKMKNVAVGLIYDPDAVALCHQAGKGATLQLSIGGKVNRFSGPPLVAQATVINTAKSAVMDVMGLAEFAMGDTAWVTVGGIDIMLSSKREQMYAPTGFSHLGLNPADKDVLVVKSSNHFQAFFKNIADEYLYVNTPGAINFDFASLPYRYFSKPFFPKNRELTGRLLPWRKLTSSPLASSDCSTVK